MRCTIPEISWHNRDPVLCIDLQPFKSGVPPYRLATGGTDSHVVIWHVSVNESGLASVVVAADLQRHQKAVNTVRFSPSGQYLASGDDEAVIIIWKPKTEHDISELSSSDSDVNKENWVLMKFLRGHLEDVYDLSWSLDSNNLISGSIDNTAILWDVQKGRKIGILSGHGGFVQGVAWDPKNKYAATLSSDRICRIHNLSTKKLTAKIYKTTLPVSSTSVMDGKVVRLFHDDTLKSFFRRLSFSPDGQLLVAPSGVIEIPDTEKHVNATYVFTRYDFSRPVVYLPSPREYTVAVRFCPLLFKLHQGSTLFALPYRMVFAVATKSNVILYDTQQPEPIAFISNIHYTRLTDLSWSGDGKLLVVSSTDGYCSIITFSENELGEEYKSIPVNSSENENVQHSENKQSQKSPVYDSSETNIQDLSVIDCNNSKKCDLPEKCEKNVKIVPLEQPCNKNTCVVDLIESEDQRNIAKGLDSKMDVDMESAHILRGNEVCGENPKSDETTINDQKLSNQVIVNSLESSEEPMEVDISTPTNSPNNVSSKNTKLDDNHKGPKPSTEIETEHKTDELNFVEIIAKKTDIDHVETKKETSDSKKMDFLNQSGTRSGNSHEAIVIPVDDKSKESQDSTSNVLHESPHDITNENEKSPSKKAQTKEICETTPSKCLSNGNSVMKEALNQTNSNVEPSLQAHNVTPVANRTPRRVQLITLSSPKSKKKLL